MNRRFQFSLRALLVATALVGAGALFVRLAVTRTGDSRFFFSQAAVCCFCASAIAFAKKLETILWMIALVMAYLAGIVVQAKHSAGELREDRARVTKKELELKAREAQMPRLHDGFKNDLLPPGRK